jgi:hypothetical protein
MKYVLLAALLILALASEASAQGRPCTDPPTGEAGKCSKQAGAVCDPTSRRWIGGIKQAYIDCIRGKGLDSLLTCTSQQNNCRDNGGARAWRESRYNCLLWACRMFADRNIPLYWTRWRRTANG